MVEVERGHMGSRCLCCFCCAEHSSEAAPTSLARKKRGPARLPRRLYLASVLVCTGDCDRQDLRAGQPCLSKTALLVYKSWHRHLTSLPLLESLSLAAMLHGTWSPQQGLHRPAVKRARRPENAETNAALLRWLSCWWNEARSRTANSAAPEAQPPKSSIAAPNFSPPCASTYVASLSLAAALSASQVPSARPTNATSIGVGSPLEGQLPCPLRWLLRARRPPPTISTLSLGLGYCSVAVGKGLRSQPSGFVSALAGMVGCQSPPPTDSYRLHAGLLQVLYSSLPVGGVSCKPTHLAA